MTSEELDALEALANAATPGPWEIDDDRDVLCTRLLVPTFEEVDELGQPARHETYPYRVASLYYGDDGSPPDNDSRFIAAAREAVPALIAALREARAELDFIKAEYADAPTEDLTRDALLLRLRVQESANESLRASVATLTSDPLPAAAWVREVEQTAFARGVAAMREAAAKALSTQGNGHYGLTGSGVAKTIRALPDPEDKP